MLYLGPRTDFSRLYCSQRTGKQAKQPLQTENWELRDDKCSVRLRMSLDLYTRNIPLTQKAKFWGNYVSALKGESEYWVGDLITIISRQCWPVRRSGAPRHQHLPLHHADHPPDPLRPQKWVRQAGESDVETKQGQVCSNSNFACCQWQVNLFDCEEWRELVMSSLGYTLLVTATAQSIQRFMALTEARLLEDVGKPDRSCWCQ